MSYALSMLKIIRHREIVETVDFRLNFKGEAPGSFYSFPCDEQGVVDEAELPAPAKENLDRCRAAGKASRVVRIEGGYVRAAAGRCVCGATVELDSFTCECDRCGRLYNSAGQELAPPEQWGEETGETAADLNV